MNRPVSRCDFPEGICGQNRECTRPDKGKEKGTLRADGAVRFHDIFLAAIGKTEVQPDVSGGACRTVGYDPMTMEISPIDYSFLCGHDDRGAHILSFRIETARMGIIGIEVLSNENRIRLKITLPQEEFLSDVKRKGGEIDHILSERGLALEEFSVECSGDGSGGAQDEDNFWAAGRGKSNTIPGSRECSFPPLCHKDEEIIA